MKRLEKRYRINISRWHRPPVKHRETSRWCELRSWEKWSLFGIRTWRNTPYLLYFCMYTMRLVLYFSSTKAVSPKLENEIGKIFWSPLKLKLIPHPEAYRVISCLSPFPSQINSPSCLDCVSFNATYTRASLASSNLIWTWIKNPKHLL